MRCQVGLHSEHNTPLCTGREITNVGGSIAKMHNVNVFSIITLKSIPVSNEEFLVSPANTKRSIRCNGTLLYEIGHPFNKENTMLVRCGTYNGPPFVQRSAHILSY